METNMSLNTSSNGSLTINVIQQIESEQIKDKQYLCLIIVIIFFVLGVFGNLLALLILKKQNHSKNSKYTLMLRYLALNNFIALTGMLIQLLLKIYLPIDIRKNNIRWQCVGLVVWRFFGLSSGCIAAIMAAERWIALARPFSYHKHVTYNIIKRAMQYLIAFAALITFTPFIGFGVYFDEKYQICLRYRHATTSKDVYYAYIFMAFGTLLCIIIVVCNFFVTQVLCAVAKTKSHFNKASNRYSFSNRDRETVTLSHHRNIIPTTSSDEFRFAKLMTFLSISFVICWMPQMISIPLALMKTPLPNKHWFFRIADVLMALHFTSDPYLYVLSRTKNSFFLRCVKTWKISINKNNSIHSKLKPTEQTIDYGLNV